MRHMIPHGEMIAVGMLAVIGVVLLALALAKQARLGDQG
jgi:hypothetical protein